MPEHTATILLVFILATCFSQRHIRQWRYFKLGLCIYLTTIALPPLVRMLEAIGLWFVRPVLYLHEAGLLATVVLMIMACLQTARRDTEHLRCLECGYILKGLSEPRCPECGRRI